MPIAIKKLGQKGGPKGQDKTMPLPKKKPRHASPKHRMNTEKTKSMAGGGKLKMVEKGGKKVPFFAADGKGKMAMGGMMKKKGMAAGGRMKKKGMAKGGMMKKGMAKGGMMKKGYAKGGAVKVKSGDTLSQIAKKNGVTLKALLGANPSIKNANKIRLGQSIKLPTNMAGSKSSNPYAGIKRGQMADMDVKNKSEKRQRTATRSMQSQVKQGGSRMTPTPSKAAATKESKSGREAMLAKARKLRDNKKAAKPTGKTLANTPKSGAAKVAETRMARLANKNKTARRAGGGMMKKKGMAKGGMMKKGMAKGGRMKKKGMAAGGVMRGTGAAIKGKRFGRSG